ncbi:MAG: YafY family transcriptional regulator, partial [Gammaproteobacteria bacterium]|nr:YafY family transcriptional regulator [Gammaproteobacteria bacterium]
MDKLTRLYTLHTLFRSRRLPVPLTAIREELDCSERTARRAIAELRDQLRAPIEYDRERNGFQYAGPERDRFELPGLWFRPDELYALLTSHQLLDALQPGLFAPYIAPIRDRLKSLLAHHDAGHADFGRRIRLLQIAARPADLDVFRTLATAVMARRRLRLLYHGRERDTTTERTVSPQRLVYYRSNWYLDSWCHLREAFRHFSLDRLHTVETLAEPAREFPDDELDRHFAGAYGIFAGEPSATATLRFTPSAARWVADEQWHPQQAGRVLDDGGYELKVPYGRPEELVMDILKYGPEVEVIGPADLRERVAQALRAATSSRCRISG